MTLAAPVVPELEHEAAITRRLLERISEADYGWKPHPRSMSLGELVSHMAQIPGWGVTVLTTEELDFDPAQFTPWIAPSNQELLAKFDEGVQQALSLLREQSDEQMQANWSLKILGQTQFTMSKAAALRTWVLNHLVHHRGQLSVYLRLRDIPVPGIYGPSADEQ